MTAHKKDIMDREKELTTYLVRHFISFDKWPDAARSARMKAFNPKGYAMLMEFLELKEAQKKAKEND